MKEYPAPKAWKHYFGKKLPQIDMNLNTGDPEWFFEVLGWDKKWMKKRAKK